MWWLSREIHCYCHCDYIHCYHIRKKEKMSELHSIDLHAHTASRLNYSKLAVKHGP